ncbi:MAG: hypothetical protein H6718_04190 [Polyangiaceae bacterium]|nr:hypothetical protein [Polyangiaceae bacterium]
MTDFERIGLAPFMKTMKAHDKRNAARFEKLRTLMTWRNAIAHQDWTKVPNQDPNLPLLQVKKWRSACNGLATSMDEVLREYLTQVVGVSPW